MTFETVDEFKRGKFYVVMADYDYTPKERLFRAKKVFCYKLQAGQRLRFRGPNFGNAEFLADDGRIVILSPKLAFKIVGRSV